MFIPVVVNGNEPVTIFDISYIVNVFPGLFLNRVSCAARRTL